MKKGLAILIFLLGALSLFGISRADAQVRDAIAIRVIPNPAHLNITSWYQSQGFSGSPQAMTVDGYEAIRDGRTVYVNVGNVNAGGSLFTNVYLISYNQDAQLPTADIFGNILSSWKFNSNLSGVGKCHFEATKNCLTDEDCAIGDYCGSAKARVIRDVNRLSDMSSLRSMIENFRSRTGKYPALSSGTYLPNKSFSAWPSWQSSLGRDLGKQLPFDPVNRFGECPGFSSETCWNEENKNFATVIPDLPDGSLVYYYFSDAVGMVADICMVSESGFNIMPAPDCLLPVCLDFDADGWGFPASAVCTHPQPDCDDSNPAVNMPGIEVCSGGVDEDCDGLVDCFDFDCTGNMSCAAVSFCGDAVCDAPGETCATCSADCSCSPYVCGDGTCSAAGGECNSCYNFSGASPSADCFCGDGEICALRGEQCDDGNNANGDGCSSLCQNEALPCTDNDGDRYIQEGTNISVCNARTVPPCGPTRNLQCLGNNDCDDNSFTRNPGVAEQCNAVDHDCDGNPINGFINENCYLTCSGNGYHWTGNSGNLNCCGNHPGEGGYGGAAFQSVEDSPLDLCSDSIDNDCDGSHDSNTTNPANPDFDCLDCNSANNTDESFWYVSSEGDCDQCNHPGDDDGNQFGENWSAWPPDAVDRCDAACGTVAVTVHADDYENLQELTCNDGFDNDCDGRLNCDDPDCSASPFCVFSCTGTIQPSWGICAGDDLGLAANTPSSLVGACTIAQKCEYTCNTGYTYLGGQCLQNCFRDMDSDGFGNNSVMSPFAVCPGIGNHVQDNTDCDDTRNYVYPGATEQCNGLNSDCNPATPVDSGCDDDNDDYCDSSMAWFSSTLTCPNTTAGPLGNDCDDDGASAAIRNPGNAEVCAGGIDEDCDGLIDCNDVVDCAANAACSGCVVNCTTPIGCQSALVANASDNGGECCGGGACYACDAGYSWDGASCVLATTGCVFPFNFPCTF